MSLFLFSQVASAETIIYDDFSTGPLNETKWEIECFEEEAGCHSEVWVDEENETFHIAEPEPHGLALSKGTTVYLTEYSFSVGNELDWDFYYRENIGNQVVCFTFGGEQTLSCVGYWNGEQYDGNIAGDYHYKIKILDENTLFVNFTKPDNTTVTRTVNIENILNGFKFGANAGHDGVIHVDYDNFVITAPPLSYEYQVDEYTLGLWHLDEGEGTIAYDETGIFHGTINGATWTDNTAPIGGSDYSLSFDGNDCVTITTGTNGVNGEPFEEFTLEAWVYPTSHQGIQTFLSDVSVDGLIELKSTHVGSGKFRIERYADSYQIAEDPNIHDLFNWYHVAGTWNGLILKLYVNGEPVDSVDSVGEYESSGGVSIGCYPGGNNPYVGIVDEVRISNTAREDFNNTNMYLIPIGNKEINENETLIIDLNATNPNNSTLTYYTNAAEVLPSPFEFDSEEGFFVWIPTFNDAGIYEVMFSVTDGEHWDSETINITVINVNRAPILDPIGDREINENETLIIDTNATDPDNDTLIYFVMPWIYSTYIFDNDTGIFEWTPTFDDAGEYEILFGVTDGYIGDSELIDVTVHNVNRLPILDQIGNKEVDENNILSILVNASDPDNDDLLYYTNAAEILPSTFYFNTYTGEFNWIPTYYDAGEYEVTFNVTDGEYWASETITITVNNVPFTDFVIYPDEIIFSNDNPMKYEIVTMTAFFHNLLEIDPDEVLVRFYSGEPSNETFIGEDLIEIRGRSSFFAQIEWSPQMQGDYDIHIWIDPLDEIPEAYEDNNIASKEIHVHTKPDIRIRDSDMAFSDNYPDHGEEIMIMAMLRNVESIPIGQFTVRVYDDHWQNIIGQTEMSLDPFETDIVIMYWNTTFGHHDIHVYADSRFIIDELNETNNHAIKNIYVNRVPTLSAIEDRQIFETQTLVIDADAFDPDFDPLLYYTDADQVLPSSFDFDSETGIFEWTPTYSDAGSYFVTFNVTDSYAWDEETIEITVNNAHHGGKFLYEMMDQGGGI
ncbi:putative Ig domain-containing protein [Candidatus Aenigmatarchaeota archaeon]